MIELEIQGHAHLKFSFKAPGLTGAEIGEILGACGFESRSRGGGAKEIRGNSFSLAAGPADQHVTAVVYRESRQEARPDSAEIWLHPETRYQRLWLGWNTKFTVSNVRSSIFRIELPSFLETVRLDLNKTGLLLTAETVSYSGQIGY